MIKLNATRSNANHLPFVVLLAALSSAFAMQLGGCATAPAYDSPPSDAQYETESLPEVESVTERTSWLQNLHTGLGDELCSDQELFRSCYPVSENDCRARVQDAAVNCEANLPGQIPEALSEYQARQWGGRIGQCTGEGLINALTATAKMNETDHCKQLLSER